MQVRGQRVDEGVQGLEGDRLTVVTPAVEDDDRRIPAERGQERLDQARLPLPGPPTDKDGHRLPGKSQGFEGVTQGRQLLPAADQLVGGARGADRRRGSGGDDPRDPKRVRPGGRVAGDQPVGQVSQIVGDSRTGRQRGGVPYLLIPHHSPRIPVERPGPGQGLVHHDADRVPVGGRPGRFPGGLLRCHVGRRPGDPSSR